MNLLPNHPINEILVAVAPILGANFVMRSARDSELEPTKYPLLEYVIHKEGLSIYDRTLRSWRVELVIQLDYLVEEHYVKSCLESLELEESLAVQALQHSITSKIRSIIQLITDPSSLGSQYKEQDFIWSKYDFKLVKVYESAYFRDIGADRLTGASTLFVLSFVDIDNVICCETQNLDSVYSLLKSESTSAKLLKIKIDNQ